MNTVLFHKLGDRLAGYAVAPVSSFGMDPRRAIALLAVLEDRTDLINQRIPPRPSRRPVAGCAAPGVEPAAAHAKHPAHQTDSVIGDVGGNEAEFFAHVFAAHCAKKTDAFRITSFSSLSRFTSRRSCANSAASAFV